MPSWMRRRCDGLLRRCWGSLGGNRRCRSCSRCYCLQRSIRKVSGCLCCGGFGSNPLDFCTLEVGRFQISAAVQH
ncbi:hypothetical protein CCHR01_11808 [Colletotrichum chrysophilum]|uniref:Uncharacterized protein n=1 Tax=Colletotrichum chrysophilum TaxID=1836956 RepID=A0AAD9ACE4_9PEZI|nr:hypothetical protein CCHR01_11808 [Colletotrichum chrysophilum]